MKKKLLNTLTGIMVITLASVLTGCSSDISLPKPDLPVPDKDTFTVGEDITGDDINEFYYTIENINLDAYYLRYKFYTEDGSHKFFYEERERPGDYGPATEDDTIAKCDYELSDEEWSKFCKTITGGTVRSRDDNPEDGGRGPWTYLYWSQDKDEYQEFSFASQQDRSRFEELCEALADEGGAKEQKIVSRKEQGKKGEKKNTHDEETLSTFREFIAGDFTQVSSRKANVTTVRDEDGIYYTEYPAELFGLADWFAEDIDGNYEDELLVIQLSGDDIYENLCIMAGVYDMGTVEMTDSYYFGENILESDDGDTFAFLYEYDGSPVIGIMSREYYYTRADGVSISFDALRYNGNRFFSIGKSELSGSSFEEEDKDFTKVLRRCGLLIDWNDLFEDDLKEKVLDVCDGKLLTDIITKTDDVKEDENYMPTEIQRHVEIKGYSDNGLL